MGWQAYFADFAKVKKKMQEKCSLFYFMNFVSFQGWNGKNRKLEIEIRVVGGKLSLPNGQFGF